MRIFTLALFGCVVLSLACQQAEVAPPAGSPLKASSPPAVSPTPNPGIPKNGKYDAKGVVTKINTKLGSVEIDHEDIPGMMPRMIMEFYVQDKKMLDGLAVGDKVDFVLEYKHPTETIAEIKKTK
jgi:Cu(I)/Ag(I) efflux system periplasmic protein CusF